MHVDTPNEYFCFGPVPSRRLGTSLGVNNIPHKTCTYSCIYCQLGRTIRLSVERRCFYDWKKIVESVVKTLDSLETPLDYVTFVPDGEPTLDKCIGKEIEAIKRERKAKIAILTNASLLWDPEVREELSQADYVSVKVDAASEATWRKVNRPHPSLKLGEVLEGIRELTKEFKGTAISETMLVKDVNTDAEELENISTFLASLRLDKAYIAIPVRPPAEPFAQPPTQEQLVAAYNVFSQKLGTGKVELLNLPEPPKFAAHGEPSDWLLAVVSVHPLRYDYALRALEKLTHQPEELIERLLAEGLLSKVTYNQEIFLIRNFNVKAKGITVDWIKEHSTH
ncbi:MAG: radical SAM protein [Thermofilum sp.]|nr:radical SAM protein [Thermofilum sp.]